MTDASKTVANWINEQQRDTSVYTAPARDLQSRQCSIFFTFGPNDELLAQSAGSGRVEITDIDELRAFIREHGLFVSDIDRFETNFDDDDGEQPITVSFEDEDPLDADTDEDIDLTIDNGGDDTYLVSDGADEGVVLLDEGSDERPLVITFGDEDFHYDADSALPSARLLNWVRS